MSSPSFNVLTEPWIPVIRLDGTQEELGILPCLEQAHELREIRDPSPIIEFGLHRLLIAFVLDALIQANKRPEDALDLKECIAPGQFDVALLHNYSAKCGSVFDLFDPVRPFLQTPMPKSSSKPISGMYPVAPSGTNASVWHHHHEDEMTLTAAGAARLLTTVAPFMTAGGAGLSPSINGAPAIYALPMGSNLFETIVLNLPLRRQDTGTGTVAWRNSRVPGEERTQATTVEALTWRPRRLQLVPIAAANGTTLVREMKFEKGDSTRLAWIDSSLAYRYEKDKVTPVRMREARPLWRDAGPLLLLSQKTTGSGEEKVAYQRPDVVAQSFEVIPSASAVRIAAYGMRTDMKMKVFEWTKATWSVPARLGRSTRLGIVVSAQLDLAKTIADALRDAIKHLYPRDGQGNKAALGCIVSRSERSYWQRLESKLQPLMNAFAELDVNAPDDPALIPGTVKPWHEAISGLASEQFEMAAQDMDSDSDALERQVRARSRLLASLKKHLS